MFNKNSKIELLAPAKNKQIAFAAIDSGADAVYVGYEKFGARSAAGNSLEDILEIVRYAHIFGVKVYVTLNTIFSDSEIISVVELISQLYEFKVDGIIIQDMGLLDFELPPIPIIASTQCHNISLEKIEFLQKTGFQRVILPREFSLEQIKNICSNTDVEIETFVHGALCVSYSGQCYLSQAIGSRSANRGECAQPCRKKYSLKDSEGNLLLKDKYLLSLKDFNLSAHLKDLILAGVTSFKIEGRLKDESYIRNVVSFYRQTLDSILGELSMRKSSEGNSFVSFTADLNKTFNRGYTTYFFNGRDENLCALNYSKSLGEKIGRIEKVSAEYFSISAGAFSQGDGLCFFNDKDEIIGTRINKIIGEKIYPNSMDGIKKGLLIYRNYNIKFESELLNSKPSRKIPVNINVYLENDEIVFSSADFELNSVEVRVQNDFEKAQNAAKSVETIKRQLSKLGDSVFSLANIEVNLDDVPFIQVSVLNSIRRELLDKLVNYRLSHYVYRERPGDIPIVQFPNASLTYEANVYNAYAGEFYKKRGVCSIEPAAEALKSMQGKRVMTTKHCIRRLLNVCSKTGNKQSSHKQLFLVDQFEKEYKLEFDCKNCEMHVIF